MKKFTSNTGRIFTEEELSNWYRIKQELINTPTNFKDWLEDMISQGNLKKIHGSIIKITYELHTDGDYSLNNPASFGAILDEFEHFTGKIKFETQNNIATEIQAKEFLQNFLCNGLQFHSDFYYIMKDFCEIIDECIQFLKDPKETTFKKKLPCDNNSFIKIEICEY